MAIRKLARADLFPICGLGLRALPRLFVMEDDKNRSLPDRIAATEAPIGLSKKKIFRQQVFSVWRSLVE